MKESPEEILQKATAPEATEKDRQKMLPLFHQEDLEFRVKEKLTDILHNTGDSGKEGMNLNLLFEKIWKLIREKEKGQKVPLFRMNTMLKIAAALVLGVFIGSLIFNKPGNLVESETVSYTSMAPKGSVSQMILPDSTFICLNSGSTLKYTFNGEMRKREVFLDGEAWFQVQKSGDNPFIVHTQFYDVNVTGTEFNVKAYREDADVVTTLEKGSLVVTSGSIRMQEPATLKPGEQLVYNKESRSISMKSVNTKWFTSWKDNKLIFINMNLKELMVLLERKYGVEIRIADPKILKYHYDGTFKNETIIEVLNLLKETLPIQYRINDQIIEIKNK